ncbi:hypothetical protein NHH03_00215 [Stieleria sp. TO1_6]|nr:hypothetical protein [Stieleria tagensis]MCO8120143.1 hypothetical protein [Stieleria tagensis]
MNQSSVCGLVDLLPTSDALSADLTLAEPMVLVPETRLEIGMGFVNRIS